MAEVTSAKDFLSKTPSQVKDVSSQVTFFHDTTQNQEPVQPQKKAGVWKNNEPRRRPSDEVSKMEMGRLMRFSQSVHLVVWSQIKLTHYD